MTNNELLRAARRVGEEAGLIDLWSAEELLAVASYIEDTARSSQTSESDVADTMIILIRSFRRIKQLENKYRKIRNAPEGKNNNWFKMHGYPMRREIAGRHALSTPMTTALRRHRIPRRVDLSASAPPYLGF